MTKIEKNWILYDVGNSAFIMMVSTIIPIYFKNLTASQGISASDSTAYWGYAASISTVIIAILGPTLGALGDIKGYKKKIFTAFVAVGVLGCLALAIPMGWLTFMVIFIIAKASFNGSLIFNDAMLPDVTTKERADQVSSHGYAWGYIGSCIPFVLCLAMILTADKTGLGTTTATMISFLVTGLWWILFTLPILRSYVQHYYVDRTEHPVSGALSLLADTLRRFRSYKAPFSFLLAFFFYIDGVYTIIDMATSYGKDVGISDNNLLLALLLTQVVAFPCAILFGRLAKKRNAATMILICIGGYFGITLFAIQLDKPWEFWFLAVCVAVFQGGIQALSRSYFSGLVPKEKSNTFFGIYDIFGKGAAFFGTLIMGFVTQMTDNTRFGVASLTLFFVAGFCFFLFHRHLVRTGAA